MLKGGLENPRTLPGASAMRKAARDWVDDRGMNVGSYLERAAHKREVGPWIYGELGEIHGFLDALVTFGVLSAEDAQELVAHLFNARRVAEEGDSGSLLDAMREFHADVREFIPMT